MNSCPPTSPPYPVVRPACPTTARARSLLERKAAEDRAAADVPGGPAQRRLHADGVRRGGAPGVFQPGPRDGDADHAEDPPGRSRRLRRLLEGRRRRPRSNWCWPPHGAAATRCNALWSPHDCPRTGSQPAHGVRRGPPAAPRVHHRRAPADGAARQPVAAEVLRACSANIDDLRKSLLATSSRTTRPRSAAPTRSTPSPRWASSA